MQIIKTVDQFSPDKEISQKDILTWSFKSLNFKPTQKSKKLCNDKLSEEEHVYFETAIKLNVISYDSKTRNCRSSKLVSRIVGIQEILSIYGIPIPRVVSEDLPVSDVSKNSWLGPWVKRTLDLKLLSPKTDKQFKPFNIITRRETAELLYNVSNYVNAPQAKPSETGKIEIVVLPNDKQIPHSDIIYDVWKQITDKYLYYDQKVGVPKDEYAYESVKGLIRAIDDPYADFSTPNELPIVLPAESFGGIGVVIDNKDGTITIVNVLKGNPAEKAGLRSGDIIRKVDGEPINGMTPEEIARKIRGKEGTQVKITVERKNEQMEFEVTRAIIEIHAILSEKIDDDIAKISIGQFEEKLDEVFDETIKSLLKENAKGFIIDLRNNPGGYVDTTVNMLGHFVPKGKTVLYLDEGKGNIYKEVSPGPAELEKFPVVVLINEGSASAAEIFAAALKDHKLATVIGTKSFGKGTAQELIKYETGETLKFTVAEWLTPNQKKIDKTGISPDIVVQNSNGQLSEEKDTQLQRAIEEIRKKLAK